MSGSAETNGTIFAVMIKVRTRGSGGKDEGNTDFCPKCMINRGAQINAGTLE